jgi:hypothetical protein
MGHAAAHALDMAGSDGSVHAVHADRAAELRDRIRENVDD